MVAGGIALMAMAFFSFFLYRRVATLANQPELFVEEERPALFSPALLEDIKAFWERGNEN